MTDLNLICRLPNTKERWEWIDALYEAGFKNAMIGVGLPGYLAVSIPDPESIDTALYKIQQAIPGVRMRITDEFCLDVKAATEETIDNWLPQQASQQKEEKHESILSALRRKTHDRTSDLLNMPWHKRDRRR